MLTIKFGQVLKKREKSGIVNISEQNDNHTCNIYYLLKP